MVYFFSVGWDWVFGLQPKARFNGSVVSYDVMDGVGDSGRLVSLVASLLKELFPNKSSGKRYYVCTAIKRIGELVSSQFLSRKQGVI
jgi:hypothetical protein